MNRRQFLSSVALAPLVRARPTRTAGERQIAITMDDPRVDETPLLSASERDAAILQTLAQAELKAALFVCGKRVDHLDGMRLLQQWNDERHLLGNHTYTHPYLPGDEITTSSFIDDILNGQEVVEGFSRFERVFRFPFLKEGNTLEKRDGVRAFLSERGYRLGQVTIDASDWYVDSRLTKRLHKDPEADVTPYRDFYLHHLWERATFYDELALNVLERPIKHTLLIHHSLLNALFLKDVLGMFEQRGWSWVDAEDAFDDAIFAESPDILPAGESIVWALAKQTGRYEDVLRYPGEDSVYEEEAMDRLRL